MKKIILLGYMGSGKSTIAQLLSEHLLVKLLDLDEVIEAQSQMSISEIFKNKGEIYFRKIEHQIFQELITSDQEFILSLGGGTPCYANNHELLQLPGVLSFYLKASPDVLFERLKSQKHLRPLLQDKTDEELKEYIAPHLFERSYFYQKATFTIDTGILSAAEVVLEIQKRLN
jgi:shikimate kinase